MGSHRRVLSWGVNRSKCILERSICREATGVHGELMWRVGWFGAHVSAGEESAREPTSVIHFLGTQGISLRVCGAENPSQGTWEPGALRVALNLGGQATAGGALQLPFPSL